MDFAAIVQRQRTFFQTGATRPLAFRRGKLEALSASLDRHESSLLAALHADLRKSPVQAYSSEIGFLKAEIRYALKNLANWTAPSRRKTSWFVAPASSRVQSEPLGVALILGPWNYPVQLLLTPLVSAIAAGNCAVLKPSELAPRTAEVIATLVRETFSEEFICVTAGGADVAAALLAERFDKIFFTGSTRVGRLVMAAAARNLTPVTLELGGKCPVIVCADAAIDLAARRIAWGKFLNAGQTCVAPDYVLVERGLLEPFRSALKKAVLKFYGDDARHSADYGRIVNAQHFARLVNYLKEGKIFHGGAHDAKDLFIEPTILTGIKSEAKVMQEEIFGPILPVLEFENLDEALAGLRDKPTPLALYLFTGDRAKEARVLAGTRSGGVCVNDVISHMMAPSLPFGGLGESGMGAYHGRAGFDTFSHSRAIQRRGTWVDTPFRYPPQNVSLSALKRAMRFLMGD